MIGPSSSHTAGVVRIGNVARRILGHRPSRAVISFHGSLAKTYRGHGSDKAIVAGLLNYKPDDMRIRDSLKHAEEKGFSYEIKTVELEGVHPNTVVLELFCDKTRDFTLQGASVGGGNILIQKIDGIDVEFDGYYDTLIVRHKDEPGAISAVTSIFTVEKINIAGMKVYRENRLRQGGDAIMVIEVDEKLNKELTTTISSLRPIDQVTLLRGASHD